MREQLKLYKASRALNRALDSGRKGLHASPSECALRAHDFFLRPLYLKNTRSAPLTALMRKREKEIGELVRNERIKYWR